MRQRLLAKSIMSVLIVLGFIHNHFYGVEGQTSRFQLTELEEPPTWDISEQGPLHLHVVAKTVAIKSEFFNTTAAYWLTRVYCYSNSNSSWDDDDCGIPGPTIIFHPNDEKQEVYLHNHLTGLGVGTEEDSSRQNYKDPDVVNLHVHGLHVNPHVDDVVDLWVDPLCPSNYTPETGQCYNGTADVQDYPYVINTTHYPGTHWYHDHWHGSTALHVNGGLYGVIKMKAYDGIENLTNYEPQLINDTYDHVIAVAFAWLDTTELCDTIINVSSSQPGTNCANSGDDSAKPFVSQEGKFPFMFAVQGWCWINCKLKEANYDQYEASEVQQKVEFTDEGEWNDTDFVKTFLVNGQVVPYLVVNTGEWHRLRIVNTNMAYLIWQLNYFTIDSSDIDNDPNAAVPSDVCQQWLISNDGIYFSGTNAPRLINNSPYNGSIVIPPGGRADLMLICLQEGIYEVIASNNTRNTSFQNAPLPGNVTRVMRIFAAGDNITDYETTCDGWNATELPCQFVPYEYSPYLADTQDLQYPDVTSACTSPYGPNIGSNETNQCNIVLQRVIPSGTGTLQLSVNHFLFSHTTPLQRIATNTTHEWLVTSNFHQFHQHIWPFQLQTRVVNGWLGQIGDWRDVVGAPSSFVARSNLVGGFYSGKLIQHCHFVPHEDHGLMAFHELMNSSYDPQPMVPEDAEGDWNTTYSAPEGYQWVKADECTPFYGLSSVDIHDSDTLIYFYFTQFTFEGYCFFGYLPLVVYRDGHPTTAFTGFGLFGSYENDWDNVVMDGTALVFTLQASDDENDDYDDDDGLSKTSVAEVELQTTHTFEASGSTPAKCQRVPFGKRIDLSFTDGKQVRMWYCVRPRTTKYPSHDINITSHFLPGDNSIGNPFGWAFAYGEGQFYELSMHASRGTCGMYLNLGIGDFGDSNNNSKIDIQDAFSNTNIFACDQEGAIIDGGQEVSTNVSFVNLSRFDLTEEAFMNYSGFDITQIPPANATFTTPMPTLSGNGTKYQLRMKTGGNVPDHLYVSLSDNGQDWTDWVNVPVVSSSSATNYNITVNMDFGNAASINQLRLGWNGTQQFQITSIRVRETYAANDGNDGTPRSGTYKGFAQTCTGGCCVYNLTMDGNAASPHISSSDPCMGLSGLPFGDTDVTSTTTMVDGMTSTLPTTTMGEESDQSTKIKQMSTSFFVVGGLIVSKMIQLQDWI